MTTLSTPETTVAPGQLVTVTAVVSPAQGGGTPTGGVQFDSLGNIPVIDAIVVPLVQVGGHAEAMFSISALDAGTHAINASYSGDSQFAPSVAMPLTVMVSITLSFGVALVPGSAQEADRYLVLGAVPDRATGVFRARLTIKSVRYNAAAENVTITLSRPHAGPVHVKVQAGLGAADGAESTNTFTVAVL
jgi:hypothetical protein